MPSPKKDAQKMSQIFRLLTRPRTIDFLVEKTEMSQVSVYRYLKALDTKYTLVKSSSRPVTFQLVP